MLLNHEPRGHAQVNVLLQLSREGDEEHRRLMLRLAAEKAAQSTDPDLLYCTIAMVCGSDPASIDADFEPLVLLLRERPQELKVVADVFAVILRQAGHFDRLRTFHERLGQARLVAQAAVM